MPTVVPPAHAGSRRAAPGPERIGGWGRVLAGEVVRARRTSLESPRDRVRFRRASAFYPQRRAPRHPSGGGRRRGECHEARSDAVLRARAGGLRSAGTMPRSRVRLTSRSNPFSHGGSYTAYDRDNRAYRAGRSCSLLSADDHGRAEPTRARPRRGRRRSSTAYGRTRARVRQTGGRAGTRDPRVGASVSELSTVITSFGSRSPCTTYRQQGKRDSRTRRQPRVRPSCRRSERPRAQSRTTTER
jgi:hypothetical protein